MKSKNAIDKRLEKPFYKYHKKANTFTSISHSIHIATKAKAQGFAAVAQSEVANG
jgi:hypothetical protein